MENKIIFIFLITISLSICAKSPSSSISPPAVIELTNDPEQPESLVEISKENEKMMKYLDHSRTGHSTDQVTMDSYIRAYKLTHENYQDFEEETSVAISKQNKAAMEKSRIKRDSATDETMEHVQFELTDAKHPDFETLMAQRVKKELRDVRSPYEVTENEQRTRIGKKIYTPPKSEIKYEEMRIIPHRHTSAYQTRIVRPMYSANDFPFPVQKAIDIVLNEPIKIQMPKLYKGYENQRYGSVNEAKKLYFGDKIIKPHLESSRTKRLYVRPHSGSVQQQSLVPNNQININPKYVQAYYPHAEVKIHQNYVPNIPSHNYYPIEPPKLNYGVKDIPVYNPTVSPPVISSTLSPTIKPAYNVQHDYQTVADLYSHNLPQIKYETQTVNPYGPLEVHTLPLNHHEPKTQYNISPPKVIQNQYYLPEQKSTLDIGALKALLGKGPSEQLKGLKELLHREQVPIEERPQDSTAPILFHPDQPPVEVTKPPHYQYSVAGSTKQIVPIQAHSQSYPSTTASYDEVHNFYPSPAPFIQPKPIQESFEKPQKLHPIISIETVSSQPIHEEHIIQQEQIHSTLSNANHQLFVPQSAGLSSPYLIQNSQHEIEEQIHETPIRPLKLVQVQHHPEQESEHNEEEEYNPGQEKDLQYASGYAFGYRVRDYHTGNDFGHTQNRDIDGITRGEYHILLPDGRIQNVKYHADEKGFHADVSYESAHQPPVEKK